MLIFCKVSKSKYNYSNELHSFFLGKYAMDEEDTPSMRDLVWAINAHVKTIDLEVMSNFHTEDEGVQN